MAKNEWQTEARARLREYRRLKRDCERLRHKIQDKRQDMNYIKAVVTDGVAVNNGDIANHVERAIELMDGLICRYTALICEREQAEHRLLDLLQTVKNEDGRRVLYLRYMEDKEFMDIAEELHLSERTLFYRSKQAIDDICSFLKEQAASSE